MIETQDTREAAPRRAEDKTSVSSRKRGRSPAPRAAIWLPVIAKCLAAIAGAILLAVIGAKAGAHGPPPNREPPPAPYPAVLTATFVAPPTLSAGEIDAGPAEEPLRTVDAGTAPPSGGLLADGRVILNVATEEELTRLPGIGPSRARAILALRQRLSKFRAVEDLLRVKGVGRKMLRRLRPSVVLDPPAAPSGGGSGAPSP